MKIEKVNEFFKKDEKDKYGKYPDFLAKMFGAKYAELFDIYREEEGVRIDFNLGEYADMDIVRKMIDYFINCSCGIHADSDRDIIFAAVIPYKFFEEVIDVDMTAKKYNL